MTNLSTEITNIEKADDGEKITYTQKMNTSAGEVSFTNTVTLVKEDKEYKLNWSNSMIFPELGDNDKIRVKTLEAERGNIYDRNNVLLAGKGNISSIFNAETFIIGFLSGLFGIVISYILIPIINTILHHYIGNIPLSASLEITHALVLVGLAIILTLIGGLIPARAASKKDPVEALRSE